MCINDPGAFKLNPALASDFREHTKQTVVGLDSRIFRSRWLMGDFGSLLYQQLLAKVRFDRNAALSPTDESQVRVFSKFHGIYSCYSWLLTCDM